VNGIEKEIYRAPDLNVNGIEKGIYKAHIYWTSDADSENMSINVTETGMSFTSKEVGTDNICIKCQFFCCGHLWAHACHAWVVALPFGLCYCAKVKDNRFTTISENACLVGFSWCQSREMGFN
jgi:hypothetical protein